jgi:hypothetical protein
MTSGEPAKPFVGLSCRVHTSMCVGRRSLSLRLPQSGTQGRLFLQRTGRKFHRFRPPAKLADLPANPQPVQFVPYPLLGAHALRQVSHSHAVCGVEQRTSRRTRIRMLVRHIFRENMPDRHQQQPRNPHNGARTTEFRFKPRQFPLPMWMILHGMIGCIHHRPSPAANPCVHAW